MRWQDRIFWPIVWTIYLGPIAFFAASVSFAQFLQSTDSCDMSTRGLSACIVAGHDFTGFIEGSAMSGFAVAFFVIPWLAIGGLFIIFLKLADSWTNS